MTPGLIFAAHELLVVVYKYLLFVNLHELVSQSAKDMSSTSCVAQGENVVGLV
jgi:hypothetical protein